MVARTINGILPLDSGQPIRDARSAVHALGRLPEGSRSSRAHLPDQALRDLRIEEREDAIASVLTVKATSFDSILAEHTGLAAQAFLTQEAHQPLAATSLPPKTEQGPLASAGLPV